ncbi:MAG: 4Fe-4S binding protein [Desulfuromonas sp.]|nr:4Fe-4S binding protein [Desulfuromonas sp.]
MNKLTTTLKRATFWRQLIQWLFLAWILYIGLRFGMFVQHFDSHGVAPLVPRPVGVDGFLPIGALASLKLWLFTGVFDDQHPAALVLLITFLLMSVVAKKSFCSWLCPVGTISEGLWKVGRRMLGRNFVIWHWLDTVLRALKYLLLGFFVKILLLDMSVFAISDFLHSPYWSLADVKMLRFFTNMSSLTMAIIAAIALLSLVYKNFWCRYLCPYGAMLGLVSMLSLFKIRRNIKTCTNCGACTQACPAQLPVHQSSIIYSPECTGCLTCISACPHSSLNMGTALDTKPMPHWVFPVVVVAIYTAGVGLGMLCGYWHSALTYADYQNLIPLLNRL